MRAAAKSLVNFFRDVCPHLLPKKYRGRFTEIDETNDKEAIIYGQQKVATKIDGEEYLSEYKKLKAAVKKMEHRHGLVDSSDEEDSDSDLSNSSDEEGPARKDKENAEELSDDQEEMEEGEDEMDEEGEDEAAESKSIEKKELKQVPQKKELTAREM